MPSSRLDIRPERYPVDAFRNDLQQVCGAFNVEPTAVRRDELQAHLSVESIGGLELARVGLNADRVHRGHRDIRRDPGEHFFLILQQQGRALLSQGDVSHWVDPGGMFVVDATRSSTFIYEGLYSQQLSVHLPREEMRQRFGKRIYGGLNISSTDPLAIAMTALLAKLLTQPESAAKLHTIEAFYSVFGALLTERALGAGNTPSADRQLVSRAITMIAERYRSPDFKTQNLADSMGVSLRRLQRAFQVIGETPHERLQRFRITAANEAIQNHTTRTITEVAFGAGFSDLSTFYRAYRKQFGHTPGQTDALRKQS
jgi:AraC family transcriptional activator of tynA and feaB